MKPTKRGSRPRSGSRTHDLSAASSKARVLSPASCAVRGVYQHCAEKHLHRYLAEFDFRFNHRTALGIGDIDRTKAAIKGVAGKRLTYHQTH